MQNYLKLVTPDEEKILSLRPHELRNSRLFVMFLHITFVPLFFFTLLNYSSGKYLAGHIDLIGFFFFIGLLFFFKTTGKYKPSVVGFVLCCQFVIGMQHLIAPAKLGTNLLWVPLIIITSAYLLGKTAGIRLGIINGLFMIIAEALPNYMHLPIENFSSTEILQYNITIIVVTTLSAFLVTDRILFEEKSYLQNLEKQKKDLFDEKETTAALLNIIAHDIATPLTLIQGRLHHINKTLVRKEPFDTQKVQGQINILIKRSQEINANVELIRQYRALGTGKLEIRLTKVNLQKVLESSLDIFYERIKGKGLSVKFHYDKEADFLVKADDVSLQMSVLNNLISNAIKFSHNNGVIEFFMEKENNKVIFSIRDHGIGIPDELKPFLFSGDRPTSRKGTQGEGGTGFGMPILKMFLDKYGANIEISQPEDGGTIFTITFLEADAEAIPKVLYG